jgi:hypothetical protein
MNNNHESKRVGIVTASDKQTEKKQGNLGELTITGGPGRPVGSQNKVPANLRADLMTVYERLGGIRGMERWAKAKEANMALFYRMLIATLPRQLAVRGQFEFRSDLSRLSEEELIEIIQSAPTAQTRDRLSEKEGSSKRMMG